MTFHLLSWKEYFLYGSACCLLYYGWLAAAYYRKDILRFLKEHSASQNSQLSDMGAGSSPPEQPG